MLQEFREFAVKGNLVDMALGIIIGAAFGGVVQSRVENIFMPLISALLGAPDFSSIFWVLRNPKGEVYTSVKAARDAGAVVVAIGLFINTVITFLGVAVATFFLVKAINRLRRQAPSMLRPPRVGRPCSTALDSAPRATRARPSPMPTPAYIHPPRFPPIRCTPSGAPPGCTGPRHCERSGRMPPTSTMGVRRRWRTW